MKASLEIPLRAAKDGVLRARCSKNLVYRVRRIAHMQEKDSSDFIREAIVERVTKFERKMMAA